MDVIRLSKLGQAVSFNATAGASQNAASSLQPATQADVAQPHWKTTSLIFGSLVFLAVMIVGRLMRNRLSSAANKGPVFRSWFIVSGVAAGGVLSIITDYFDIFKKATYDTASIPHPDWHTVFWASVWAAVAGYAGVVSIFIIARKESEETSAERLTDDLAQTKTAMAQVQRQRDLHAEILAIAGKAVDTKKKRFAALTNKEFTIKEFIEAADPKSQMAFILKVICDFYAGQMAKDQVLRLGLYMRDPDARDKLSQLTCCDSTENSGDCFKNVTPAHLDLMDARGATVPLGRCYHGGIGATIIEDICAEEASAELSKFLPQDAKTNSQSCRGSMVCFK